MIEITNKLFQPLTLQTMSGMGLHLLPRGAVSIVETEMSDEIRRAARRGIVRLQAATFAPEAGLDEIVTGKAGKRKEG